MKKHLAFFLGILFSAGCYAQNTAVTATVVDSDGTAWSNGTWTMSLTPGPSNSNTSTYTIDGVLVSPSVINQTGTLDASGALSVTVYETTRIAPSGSRWLLNVCPKASSQCSQYSFAAVGASQSISSQLTAVITAPRFLPVSGSYGYNDVEAQLPLKPGSTYYNVTISSQRTYNGSAWNNSGNVATIPNIASWYVTQACNGQPNCTQIYGDTQYVVDATSNSTTTLTCPDCNFTSADVGKVAWATTQGTGVGVGYLTYTTFVCPQTTIASVTNSTTVVLSNTCTASGSGNVVFIWGHDDGATLAGLDAIVGCSVIHLATQNTFIMTGQPFLVNPTGGCNNNLMTAVGAPRVALQGDGFGGSQAILVMTPNFNYAGCKNPGGASKPVCFGGQAREVANLQVWGTGITSASNSNCTNGNNTIIVSGYPPSTILSGVDVAGICPGATGMIGIEQNSFDEVAYDGGAQEVGTIACQAFTGKGMSGIGQDCRNDNVSGGFGLKVVSGAQITMIASYPIVGALVNGATMYSEGTSYLGAGSVVGLEVQSGGTYVGHEDLHNGLKILTGGFASESNGNFQPFLSATITNQGNFTDLGANYWVTNPPSTTSTGVWQASSSTTLLFGSCRGVATASTTLGLYGLGQFATQNCTSTVVNLGQPYRSIGRAGKVSTLACNSTAAGVNASSGVVTVLKNGSPTTITATFGTTTFAQDSTHTDTPALGDVYAIQVTTQVGETLANITCTLLAW